MATEGHFDLRGDGLPDDVQTTRYRIREGLSELFQADVEITTQDVGFDVSSCLRKSFALRMVDREGDRERLVHGICDGARFLAHTGQHLHFSLRLRPSLASLAHREDCRIYQDQSPIAVISQVLQAAGIEPFAFRLSKDYAPREYIVQYRESELAFVERLLEHEGIFYFFEHDTDGHKLVFADTPDAFLNAEPVRLALSAGHSNAYPLTAFRRTKRIRPRNVMLRDYDFKRPQNKPEAQQAADGEWPLTVYEYPGGFTDGPVGAQLATARISELRRDADQAKGTARCATLRVGSPFEVVGATPASLDGVYVVSELVSEGAQTFDSDTENRVGQSSFKAMPAGAPYAPPRKTPCPKIFGLQTATVTGSSSEDQAIHCDNFGRVKVRFHWDRVGQYDDLSSCWLRVMQPPMGGSMIIPRFGWEVAVGFHHGDPDKPYVISRLYDGQHAPPYALPGAQASGSLKSRSSPGGAGHNEIKLSDSGGSQGFGVHAQKDYNITVEHDKTEEVGIDEEHNVTVNRSTSIGSNETCSVGGNQSVEIGALCTANVAGSQSILVGGNSTDNTTSNYAENVGANRDYTVGGNLTTINNTVMQTIGTNFTKQVGSVMLTASVASIADNIAAAYTENVGALKLDLSKGVCSESVGGAKMQTYAAAEIHLVKGTMANTCDGMTTQLVGGLHYEKIAGDYSVKAPMITLLGAIGDFKAGGTNLKLGGGPIVLKSSKIGIEGAMIIKMGGSLKLGPG